jgi:hypothetical protein
MTDPEPITVAMDYIRELRTSLVVAQAAGEVVLTGGGGQGHPDPTLAGTLQLHFTRTSDRLTTELWLVPVVHDGRPALAARKFTGPSEGDGLAREAAAWARSVQACRA